MNVGKLSLLVLLLFSMVFISGCFWDPGLDMFDLMTLSTCDKFGDKADHCVQWVAVKTDDDNLCNYVPQREQFQGRRDCGGQARKHIDFRGYGCERRELLFRKGRKEPTKTILH